MRRSTCVAFALLVVVSMTACGGVEPAPLASTPVYDPPTDDRVTIRESTVAWETYRYELTEENTILPGSFDTTATMSHSFQAWILENEYLKVTVVPEFGGRILSILYKPTGHEELYQNPLGTPYIVGEGTFYYDWLMIYGGIFPTFPEPEHGKTWLLPWTFDVVENTDRQVTVAMSMKDDVDIAAAPPQYDVGETGIEVTFYVTLRAGRAAVDTRIELSNPQGKDVAYEYWTNVGLAPGSDPTDPRTTAGAEIIAPVEQVKMPPWWPVLLEQETPVGKRDVYTFTNLREFENWSDMGIAYAYPNMGGASFWGVINHDNEEGMFRIADNTVTPGLKIWTYGYESVDVDPYLTGEEWRRPFIEMWAGVSPEFWVRETFPANHRLTIEETYGPSVGLTGVTHADMNFLVNLTVDSSGKASCQLFALHPGSPVDVSLTLDDVELYRGIVTPDPANGNQITFDLPAGGGGGRMVLTITTPDGVELFRRSIPVGWGE